MRRLSCPWPFLLASLTLAHAHRPDLTGDLKIAKPDWETYCHKVADLIVGEQTPARVLAVRAKLYELLAHCIPPSVIIKVRSHPSTQDGADWG